MSAVGPMPEIVQQSPPGLTATPTLCGLGVGEAAGGLEQTVVIGPAAGTASQVDGRAGIHARGVGARQLKLDVGVEDVLARRAAGVSLLRAQQLLEVKIIDHLASILLPDRMPRGGHPGAQVAPGVEQVLVERVAVGAELDGEHVDRDLVERDRHEHLALPVRQLADRG